MSKELCLVVFVVYNTFEGWLYKRSISKKIQKEPQVQAVQQELDGEKLQVQVRLGKTTLRCG